jgi:hypothetical protein
LWPRFGIVMAKRKTKPRKLVDYIPHLPAKLTPAPEKLILGLDPGSRNHGIALVGLVKGKPVVYANSVMNHPVSTLIEFNSASKAYLEELDEWMAYSPDGVVAERFQTRGNGGPLIEMVSVMLGLVHQYGAPVKLTIASAWKNAIRRKFGLDLREDVYPYSTVEPHQIDAALIGIYGIEQGTGVDLDYDFDTILKQIEKTSLI